MLFLFTILLPMSAPRGFAWALAAFLCCPSEISFHRIILELNAGNDASEVLMVPWDICRCRQKVSTDFSCRVSIGAVLGADVSYRFAWGGHLLSCRALWAFPRNNNFITMTLDVPKMFINTIAFCLSSYVSWIERIKFIFLVLKQLYFTVMKAATTPLPSHVGGASSARQAAVMFENKMAAASVLGSKSLGTDR